MEAARSTAFLLSGCVLPLASNYLAAHPSHTPRKERQDNGTGERSSRIRYGRHSVRIGREFREKMEVIKGIKLVIWRPFGGTLKSSKLVNAFKYNNLKK